MLWIVKCKSHNKKYFSNSKTQINEIDQTNLPILYKKLSLDEDIEKYIELSIKDDSKNVKLYDFKNILDLISKLQTENIECKIVVDQY